MKTYRELVYIILDELKILSDDSLWENEHVVFMLNKYRALLFKQRYSDRKKDVPFAYYQRLPIHFKLKNYKNLLYMSEKKIPTLIDLNNIWTYTFINGDENMSYNLNFINPQRFKSVGSNKWLLREVFATIDLDAHMYLKVQNSGLTESPGLIDESVDSNQIISEVGDSIIAQLTGASYFSFDAVLDNPIDILQFTDDIYSDPLDVIFPVEEAMIQPVVDLCIKELGLMNQQKRDASNNANDEPSTPGGSVQQPQQQNGQ